MSQSHSNQKFYVVFEGRKPGIYLTWSECDKQVNGYKGNRHKAYTSYDEAEFHWACYQNNNAKDKGDTQSNFKSKSKASSSNTSYANPGYLPQDSANDSFIIEQSMQILLLQVCHILQFPSPWYTIQEVKYFNDVQYCRFYGIVATREAGRQFVCLGKFVTTDYEAQENVAMLLITKLLALTGKKIKDYNFYTVQDMQVKLQKMVDEKLEAQMEIDLLREQIKQLSTNETGSIK